MALEIVPVPVLSDNYVWLMHDNDTGETVVIDPALAEPVLAAARERSWQITQIWNTHWHPDHTGGNAEIKAATGCTVVGPEKEAARIPTLDRRVCEGDRVSFAGRSADVWETPAHTSGHIAYHLPDDAVIFVGDTLFVLGCGRLFEGSAEDMYANLQRMALLPGETLVYCAHEYTMSNARFALHVDGGNADLVARVPEIEAARAKGLPTVPTTIAEERRTNPFMRAASADALAELRAAKDGFRG